MSKLSRAKCVLCVFTIYILSCSLSVAAGKKNMILVYMDDLRADLNLAYSRRSATTPNLDRFSAMQGSLVVGKAYANYPMCGPSRTSTLYGKLPTDTLVLTNLDEDSQANVGDAGSPSLPRFLQSKGYYTATGGKVFHEAGINGDDCWNKTYAVTVKQKTSWCQRDRRAVMAKFPKTRLRVSPQICITKAPLKNLRDIAVAQRAAKTLQQIVKKNQMPFFLAVGFYKPHVPLQVHQQFWKLAKYTPDTEFVSPPGPRESYVFPNLSFSEDGDTIYAVKKKWADLSVYGKPADYFRNVLRRAYAAGVAQTDHAFGIVFNQVEKLGLLSNTLIVAMSDHGYILGENNLWAKNMLFETALHVPLIISAPWLIQKERAAGTVNRLLSAFVELVDIYKTSTSLLGVSGGLSSSVAGVDQSAIVSQAIANGSDPAPGIEPSGNALSVVARCGYYQTCVQKKVDVSALGFSYRDKDFRYTVWMRTSGDRAVDWNNPQSKITEELYSHANDAQTVFNYENEASYNTEMQNLALEMPDITAEYFYRAKLAFTS